MLEVANIHTKTLHWKQTGGVSPSVWLKNGRVEGPSFASPETSPVDGHRHADKLATTVQLL